MAINFPDTPAVDDIYTVDGKSWKWDGTTWKSNASASVVTVPNYLALAGGTMTGGIVAATPSTSVVPIRIPHGTAPSSPVDGDVWTTTAGLFIRVNGTTVGPIGSGGSPYAVSTKTGSSYTMTITDLNTFIQSSTLTSISLPTPATHTSAPVGTWFGVSNLGAGTLAISANTNTLRQSPSAGLSLSQHSNVVFVKISSNEWAPVGGTPYWETDGTGSPTKLLADPGSTSVPPYSTLSASSTGIYFPANALGITVEGTERFKVNNAGLITGAGTSLGAWTSYTPTIAGTGWAIGNGTRTPSTYCQIGKTVFFRVTVQFGTTSTYGASQLEVGLPPVTPLGSGSPTQWHCGHGIAYNGSWYPIHVASGASTFYVYHDVSPQTNVTSTVPFTWANTNSLSFMGFYEAA